MAPTNPTVAPHWFKYNTLNICSPLHLPRPFTVMSTYTPPVYAAPTPNYDPNYLYTPTHNPQNSLSMSTLHDEESTLYDAPENPISRTMSRTPSPTPSEFNALNGIKEKKSTREQIQYYAIIAVVLAAVIVISIEHENIINGLKPATDWLARTKGGFLVVVAILVVLSFPPLFGAEIVAILVIRYSAIPPHFATAVFSTVGISFWIFCVAAVLSMPKTLVPVYVGYAMRPDNDNSSSTKVERIVLAISIVITIGALVWIRRLQEAAKPDVIYARRKARQGKLLQNHFKSESEQAAVV
ncbi:hypothetical protein C8R47DRAFT_581857 [Mycena vitilis]|nr:hypothetical protein C8R47DRAFT_581857 [Mycena vitilis]